MDRCRSIIWSAVLLFGLSWPSSVVVAQEEPLTESDTEQPQSDRIKIEPGKAPCFEATDGKSSKQLEDEAFANLVQTYKAWLTEDVAYIIQPGARCAFLKLENDDEREQFVEQFWPLLSSNPDAPDNSFKEEHYRRIVFANEKFATEIPGWKSDRGRIYILLGPPDTVDSDATGEPVAKPPVEGTKAVQYSREKWHYRYLEGIGKNMDLEFVDQKGSGDYRLTVPLAEKDFLALAPPYNWHDWKDYEPARFTLTSGSELTVWDVPVSGPRVRFKDLEAMVVAHIIRAQLYFSHRVEYVRATHASTMAHIVIDIPDNNSSSSDGQVPKAFEIFGRISNLSGRVVDTFERNGSLAERKSGDQPDPDREEIFPLAPGSYRLAIVVKNALSGETGVVYAPLDVPTYEELAIRK